MSIAQRSQTHLPTETENPFHNSNANKDTMPDDSQGGVVTLTQGTTNTDTTTIASQFEENRNDSSTPITRLLMLPSLLSGRGAEIVVSILSMARAKGWENSLCHG